jgi:large subunit ribosomal protein L3
VAVEAFIAKKVGMTQVFSEEGSAIPVTVLQLADLTVTAIKTKEKHGYSAIQVGYEPSKEKHLTKAQMGHLKKNDLPLFRHLKEFRVDATVATSVAIGDVLPMAFVQPAVKFKITGQSIGKGTMGNIRRWGHHRGPMSHGSKSHRLPGSIGAGTTPGRVFRGLPIANLAVVKVLPEKKLVLIKGSVPGVEGGYLFATRTK